MRLPVVFLGFCCNLGFGGYLSFVADARNTTDGVHTEVLVSCRGRSGKKEKPFRVDYRGSVTSSKLSEDASIVCLNMRLAVRVSELLVFVRSKSDRIIAHLDVNKQVCEVLKQKGIKAYCGYVWVQKVRDRTIFVQVGTGGEAEYNGRITVGVNGCLEIDVNSFVKNGSG